MDATFYICCAHALHPLNISLARTAMYSLKRRKITQTYDIIIGSGAGGLTAAVALAHAGQKVLVSEQHDVPGGWTHSSTLGGYRFSPGVHYIGGIVVRCAKLMKDWAFPKTLPFVSSIQMAMIISLLAIGNMTSPKAKKNLQLS